MQRDFQHAAQFSVGNRPGTKFCLTKCLHDMSLYTKYLELFAIASNPDILIKDVLRYKEINLAFLRNLSDTESASSDTLLLNLGQV